VISKTLLNHSNTYYVFYTPDEVRAVILTEMYFLMHRMEYIQHSVTDSTFRRGVASDL
jgi:hypothetical protein